ncbi:MAG: lasso RiPP family leader peptide-containing protein [Chloroflexota bacterium]
MMKRKYMSPAIVKYGNLTELTLGASGKQPDFSVVSSVLVPDINNPNCSTNAFGCFNIS